MLTDFPFATKKKKKTSKTILCLYCKNCSRIFVCNKKPRYNNSHDGMEGTFQSVSKPFILKCKHEVSLDVLLSLLIHYHKFN